ncbi:hypothetical protein KKH13_00370 [Patescibacteria group bacterium]|nr:hypothetical protein [Patescibacteria group bacterium]
MKWLLVEWLLTLSLFGLLARLVSVQVVNHDYYLALARENRIKLETIPADRGVIFDRFKTPLNRNAPEGRQYDLGEAGSAVLGYVGQGDREIVGKDGLERIYDNKLKGKPGGLLLETDAAGALVREIGRSEPVPGDSLMSTLDAGLQQKAYALLSGRKGAVVASDPGNGEILALVSSPGFKPQEVEKYLTDQDLPLFNRALGGVYPPGSTFKLITATAALEEGKADASTQIEDTGKISIGPYSYANWYFTQYGRTEGFLDIIQALKRSNDIFFYRLGERLGIRALADWAKFFGVGNSTGVDLPGEAEGLMPDPTWKEAQKKEDWFLGDTLITAIGQGDILMTPLQVNQMTSVIASTGQWCRPHLVAADKEDYCRRLDIQPQTIDLITSGMAQVTQAGGTAWPFFDFPVSVAGKTGTAEFGGDDKTHAWFTGFAPVDSPNIVVTVLLEGAGEGSYEAAPVAKDLLAYWFSRQ